MKIMTVDGSSVSLHLLEGELHLVVSEGDAEEVAGAQLSRRDATLLCNKLDRLLDHDWMFD